VGTQVAAYFRDSSNKKAERWKLFCGRVTKYGPPSSDGDPPLYHIVWEDGDEEDYTDKELEKAKKLFREKGTPPPVSNSSSPSPEKKAGKGGALRSTSRRSLGDIASISNSESSTVQLHKKRKTESSPSSPSAVAAAAASPVLKKKSSVVVETEEADPSAVSSDEEPQWTTVHDIVGKRVVAYFAVDEGSSSGSVPFGGQVTRYSPPSRPGRTDQLYHIVWDDGVRDE
jgi:hypothetical protein